MSLACGGRGPCCHVGYPHRHCEHCDVVIPTQHCHHFGWPYGTYYGNYSGLAQQYSMTNQLQSYASSQAQQQALQALQNLSNVSHMHVVEVETDGG